MCHGWARKFPSRYPGQIFLIGILPGKSWPRIEVTSPRIPGWSNWVLASTKTAYSVISWKIANNHCLPIISHFLSDLCCSTEENFSYALWDETAGSESNQLNHCVPIFFWHISHNFQLSQFWPDLQHGHGCVMSQEIYFSKRSFFFMSQDIFTKESVETLPNFPTIKLSLCLREDINKKWRF